MAAVNLSVEKKMTIKKENKGEKKKKSLKKLRKFEKATCSVRANYSGFTYLFLLGITQIFYMQGKYDLVCDICDVAIKSLKKNQL